MSSALRLQDAESRNKRWLEKNVPSWHQVQNLINLSQEPIRQGSQLPNIVISMGWNSNSNSLTLKLSVFRKNKYDGEKMIGRSFLATLSKIETSSLVGWGWDRESVAHGTQVRSRASQLVIPWYLENILSNCFGESWQGLARKMMTSIFLKFFKHKSNQIEVSLFDSYLI